jgi:hypothetical protein
MKKKRNVTNEDLMTKLEKIDEDSKRAKNFAIVTIGFAFIAITIPLIIELTSMPTSAKWAVVIIYFGVGMYFILSQYNKLKKKGK